MFRIIGDCHHNFHRYYDIVKDITHPSILLGDCGIFTEDDSRQFQELNLAPQQHTFIRGNHDNPKVCRKNPHYLGDFGCMTLAGYRIFYISGAYSIDTPYRTCGVDWWPDEQLSSEDMDLCYDLYTDYKPDIVLSHDCPSLIARQFIGGSIPALDRTKSFLQRLCNGHAPRAWYFGHHHISWQSDPYMYHTHFQCLAELEYIDIAKGISP
jgi:hypothetical protein